MYKLLTLLFLLFVSNIYGSSVILYWNTNTNIIGYILKIESISGVSRVIDLGLINEYEVDLIDGMTYKFSIICYDRYKTSKQSNIIVYTPKPKENFDELPSPKLKLKEKNETKRKKS